MKNRKLKRKKLKYQSAQNKTRLRKLKEDKELTEQQKIDKGY